MEKPTCGLFIMGGTIDSRNDPEFDGETRLLRKSLVSEYLRSIGLEIQMDVYKVCMKDSRRVNNEDGARLIKLIDELDCSHNVVTSGTYKMREIARLLFEKEDLHRDKTIVITGSMSTLLGTVTEDGKLSPSDAGFNLGFAVANVLLAESGVYQAMNGYLFKQPYEEWWHDEHGIHMQKSAS